MVCNYRKTFGQPMISTPEGYSELNTELRRAIIQDINFEMRKANDRKTASELVLHFQEEYRIVYGDFENYPDDVALAWVDRIVLNNREEIDNETWLFSHEYPTGSSISWQSVKDQIPTDTLIEILRELQRLNNHPISEVEEVEETND